MCIVDDDASVRKSLGNLLKSAGYRPASFESGEAFLESEAAGTAGCLLLDMCLQGMHGLEVQRQLLVAGRTISVICMSAHADDHVKRSAYAAGAISFLDKPFDDLALLERISVALAQYDQARI
ncbi:response regulator transcription factor [Pseudomonas asuensis]|uniref:response regulator transcription factor n=1 Tax=Pseudomonas asuensis TaxID=1825787 RepID=UPI0016687320|nr:response regulator [Pseudomonas asuensis]